MEKSYLLEELAASVQEWCVKHKVFPVNGQAAEQITERTIRYYRSLGLLDAPGGGYIKNFTEKHRLQLLAIRIYQAQGFPLRKIRDELYGKGEQQLRDFVQSAAGPRSPAPVLLSPPDGIENWTVIPLNGDFMLICRRKHSLPSSLVQKIKAVLAEELPAIRPAPLSQN